MELSCEVRMSVPWVLPNGGRRGTAGSPGRGTIWGPHVMPSGARSRTLDSLTHARYRA